MDPQPLMCSCTHESDNGEKMVRHRCWFFKGEAKEKKGLNPKAKVFQFKKTFSTFPSMSQPLHGAGIVGSKLTWRYERSCGSNDKMKVHF